MFRMPEPRELTYDPMIYDVLLELSYAIGAIYLSLSREADTAVGKERWKQEWLALKSEVNAVDVWDGTAVQAKRDELRERYRALEGSE